VHRRDEAPARQAANRFFNGAFTCDNLAKTCEELKGRGVEFTQEPKQEPWGTFTQFKRLGGQHVRAGIEVGRHLFGQLT
jgi:glyoxalase/bleomycin resistance protein/dioxygenase superfamily protein